ncbi:MAG: histidine kinase [Ignavibacteria bacterium]|nr:histidine kinase [Ignavibacteria bacterium]
MSENIETYHAPIERATRDEILKDYHLFLNSQPLKEIFDAIPEPFMILNEHRQIVFFNKALLSPGYSNAEDILSLRPGEYLNCDKSAEMDAGCGTSKFCRTCGAVNAVLAAQFGNSDIQECSIVTLEGKESLDYRVWASPLKFNNKHFTLFYILDISHENRRRNLERIFFHDIINLAGGLQGLSQVLLESDNEDIGEIKQVINNTTNALIDEIMAQKDLARAENNEYQLSLSEVFINNILEDVANTFRKHKIAQDKNIVIENCPNNTIIKTDAILLKRVIGNMLKNALEASFSGESVTISCQLKENNFEIRVHNSIYIPEEIQMQIFKRSYSTKGIGRGLGTYSMKLLTERYLNGRVSFTSEPGSGTTFKAEYPINL